MKAIVYREYDPPGGPELAEVPMPIPADDEVLVRVRAAAVNPGDWYLLSGTPYLLRLASGLFKPRHSILGLAIAGHVESAGSQAGRFAAEDEVYCEVSRGGFAEYVAVPEASLAPKPKNVSYEQSAAVPVVGVTALQGLRDTANVQPGEKVLITGASGGVGTFAVQIAKWLGAEVTGVCSGPNEALVRSIGADDVVDYTKEDFTSTGQRYDIILDNVGNRSLSDCRRALTPRGQLLPNSNSHGGRWIGGYLKRAVQAGVVSPFVSQRLRPFSATGSTEDLATLSQLIEAESVTPIVDRVFPLDETAEALRYYGKGHTRGKVIITM